MPIIWTKPTIPGAASFAEIDGGIVGLVSETAFADGRWIAKAFPRGPKEDGYYCYAGTEARAREFVENWLKYHAPDTTGWTGRIRMPHEGSR